MTSTPSSPDNLSYTRHSQSWWKAHWHQLVPALAMVVLTFAGIVAFQSNTAFRVETMLIADVLVSGDQARIRDYLHGYGVWGPIISVSLLIVQAVIAPVPASILLLANGVVYGTVLGGVLNLIGLTIGAMLAFAIARLLGKGSVERLAGKVTDSGRFESWLEKWGGKALFLIRLVPGMPSEFMSYVAGLTRMPLRTYIIATVAGIIPESFFFSWLGDAAMSQFWWIILGGTAFSALIALGTLIAQQRLKRLRAQAAINTA